MISSTSQKQSSVALSSWFSKKRKRLSSPYPTPSPSPPLHAAPAVEGLNDIRMSLNDNASGVEDHCTRTSASRQRLHLLPPEIVLGEQPEQIPSIQTFAITPVSESTQLSWPPARNAGPSSPTTAAGRRRSSIRLREISAPKRFDIKKPIVFSQSLCNKYVCCVSRTLIGPGWRIETRPRSPEICFTTSRPLYSALSQSPLRTGKSFTMYYEGQIERTNEDTVCLALGFVAGKDRILRMPGFERGSIGIDCRDGQVYVNDKPIHGVETEPFEPRQRLGLGMTFSKSCSDTSQVNSSPPGSVAHRSVDVELFLTRDGKRIGSWSLEEILGQDSLSLRGLESFHDLYPAVGTLRDIVVDIWFDRDYWEYTPPGF